MLTKLRIAALGLAVAAVLIAPASALADDPAPEGTPEQWTYNGGNAQGWTYNPSQQTHPSRPILWKAGFNLCEVIDC